MPVQSLEELLAWNPPPQREIVYDYIIIPNSINVIFGSPGSWKSMLGVHTSLTIPAGKLWLGHRTSPTPIFYFQTEMPDTAQWKRIKKSHSSLYTNGDKPGLIFYETSDGVKIDQSYGKIMLEKSIIDVKSRLPPNSDLLVILDPASKLVSGSLADEQDTKRFLDNLVALKKTYNLTFLIIHHSRKAKTDNEGKVIKLGAGEMFGGELEKWCDTVIQTSVVNPFTGGGTVLVDFLKVRHAEYPIASIEITWDRKTLIPVITNTHSTQQDEPAEVSVRNLQ